jgi:hypothetical protein
MHCIERCHIVSSTNSANDQHSDMYVYEMKLSSNPSSSNHFIGMSPEIVPKLSYTRYPWVFWLELYFMHLEYQHS